DHETEQLVGLFLFSQSRQGQRNHHQVIETLRRLDVRVRSFEIVSNTGFVCGGWYTTTQV
ncbi:MAG: hypothetical protein ACI85N_002287, partial [Gammaproteobacteria bacterium]